ncbi:hypothetical protein CIG75_03770 [Tumebacillus algifaecis]|uniref:TOG domain-containing protein n=1 Tax=Tumebacillus algifaecis TaxID=1214604 RepID=A0A223CXY1_9BACL|nr:hypothetical protein [Tumebacillus algifaecis]ASS74188.1 hypothetical protein CIG75_03770 [Tumebacillus algifaecis]
MTLLQELSTAKGEKTQASNINVATQCLASPTRLEEIAAGLHHPETDAALIADCAEVFTKVAEERPELVVPYADALLPLLTHKTTRARWEAMHAIALIAHLIAERITPLLPTLRTIIEHDKSVIVRDYAVETLSNYAKAGGETAHLAHPLLREALTLWVGKHRARALKGLANVVTHLPSLAFEMSGLVEDYLQDAKGVVKKAAKELQKACQNAH